MTMVITGRSLQSFFLGSTVDLEQWDNKYFVGQTKMNSKTRVVNYRKRLLEKPEIYRQIKEKDAERKREERRKMTEDEKILRCEKDRRRKQKSREANAAKAAEVLLVNEIIP